MGTWERGCSLISMPAPERPRPLCAWPAHNHSLCGGLAPALALALAPHSGMAGVPTPHLLQRARGGTPPVRRPANLSQEAGTET